MKDRTVIPPGTAKNCLTVGACENHRPKEFLDTYGKWFPYTFTEKPLKSDGMADSVHDIAAFSSRGPCQDDRRKPDLVAPGTFILSTRSSHIAHSAYAPYTPAIAHYMYMSGTSMATPLVAGSAALVRQYLRTKKGIENPSAALLKAALIHSAEYIKYCYADESSQKWADNEQGWGRINLSRIIEPPYKVIFLNQDQELPKVGSRHEYQLNITDNSFPLRVTLVYSDYPGAKLVNNLNLLVYNSTINQYHVGNYFDSSVSLDNIDRMTDKINNVEGCIIEKPETGSWKIRITFASYDSDKSSSKEKEKPQNYALVVSGKIADWQ